MKHQIVKLCANILHARANNNLKNEQKQYDKLRLLCERNNINFSNALDGGTREAKKSIAVQMRGIK